MRNGQLATRLFPRALLRRLSRRLLGALPLPFLGCHTISSIGGVKHPADPPVERQARSHRIRRQAGRTRAEDARSLQDPCSGSTRSSRANVHVCRNRRGACSRSGNAGICARYRRRRESDRGGGHATLAEAREPARAGGAGAPSISPDRSHVRALIPGGATLRPCGWRPAPSTLAARAIMQCENRELRYRTRCVTGDARTDRRCPHREYRTHQNALQYVKVMESRFMDANRHAIPGFSSPDAAHVSRP
jgi:hypothetical protein